MIDSWRSWWRPDFSGPTHNIRPKKIYYAINRSAHHLIMEMVQIKVYCTNFWLKGQRLNHLNHWDIHVIGEEVYLSSRSSLAFNKIHIMESVCQVFFLWPGNTDHSLYWAISQLLDLGPHRAIDLSFCPYHKTILFKIIGHRLEITVL